MPALHSARSRPRPSSRPTDAVLDPTPITEHAPVRPSARSGARFVLALAGVVAFYAFCLHFAEIDLKRLWAGLPRLATWLARAWPPDFSELDTLLRRAAETLAM